MRGAAAIALCLLAATASARNADGTLGLIATPNDGQPAVTAPGETFTVSAREEAALHLEREGVRVPLETVWTTDRGRASGRCAVPDGTPPGLYAIEADQSGAMIDRTLRAVEVRESAEATAYVIRCIADPRVGADSAPLAAALAKLSGEPGAFVLITGSLTATGAEAEYDALLAALGACGKPTVVCPGPNDGAAFDRYFAGGPQGFAYGRDGYLLLDGRWSGTAVDALNDPGSAHALRRGFKPYRWTVAAVGGSIQALGMRAQLDLFADDPVDALITAAEADGAAPFFPWGATAFLALPAADGGARTVRVNPAGLVLIGAPPAD